MQFPTDFISTIQINPVRISTTHFHLRKDGSSIVVLTYSDRDFLEVYDNEYMQKPAMMTSEQLENYLSRETSRKLAKIHHVRLN